ncbi:isoprenyl transferase [Thermincola potens]|uniref:Isoprenyl transferase n=1 Tax=Thermincola potens (strain JR) TaxID=635013 RepID=D5XEZ8_THEPJ|nr:isoprenyl transferase [Thermincola potens]ADG82219.1 undecaprenyl diphosphate synthase [Thermincola potens JR]
MGFWNKIFGKSRPNPAEEKELLAAIDMNKLPMHIAIIMDGNGRWAARRGLPRAAGHRAGVESLRDIVKTCSSLGIKYLTVYAFSTENWKRPQEEVNILMDLLVEYLGKEMRELHQNNVKVRAIGRIEELPASAQKALSDAFELTGNNTGLTLTLALNYGGRLEIVEAVQKIAGEVLKGRLDLKAIDEKVVNEHLYTVGMPDPDLVIRPSGELRISNFLLWQMAYSELWYSPVLWPSFRKVHLLQAIIDFQKRQRRFGGL